MELDDLMIGDLVFNTEFKEYNRWIAGDFLYTNPNNIEPITLTEDILKDNGWMNKKGQWKHAGLNHVTSWMSQINRWHPKRMEDRFCIVSFANGKFGLLILSRLYTIEYVHELQHALRFCGLNDIADNFKPEDDEDNDTK